MWARQRGPIAGPLPGSEATMNDCVDRWTLAEPGECKYCGARAPVFPEPFGQRDACRPCWEQICYGEGED
jgi:hypothetical protein